MTMTERRWVVVFAVLVMTFTMLPYGAGWASQRDGWQFGGFLVGVEDGKIRINDCNSRVRSEKLWEFDDIKSQIRNLWVYEK